jgi:hypothetical protein
VRRVDRRRVDLDRWPRGTEPAGAAVFVHNERVIEADRNALWALLVRAEDWPRWYPNARHVQILGGRTRLGQGTAFRWRTFGVDVRSDVVQFEPQEQLGWLWWAPGLYGYHGWRLEVHPLGARVITEETQRGPRASRLARPLTGALAAAHRLWLTRLAAQASWGGEPESQG